MLKLSKVHFPLASVLALGLSLPLQVACEAGETDGDSEAESGDTQDSDDASSESSGEDGGSESDEDGDGDSETETADGEVESDEGDGESGSDDEADETDEGDESASDDGEETGDEWDKLGECRIIGEGKFEDGAYQGKVAYVLLADMGNGDELCRVEFSIETIKDSPYPCDDCYWSTFVKITGAETIVDSEGRCANSDRGLDEDAIAEFVDQEMGFAFEEERTGHGEVLIIYNEDTEQWEEESYGSWDRETGAVTYENIEGFCTYPGE